MVKCKPSVSKFDALRDVKQDHRRFTGDQFIRLIDIKMPLEQPGELLYVVMNTILWVFAATYADSVNPQTLQCGLMGRDPARHGRSLRTNVERIARKERVIARQQSSIRVKLCADIVELRVNPGQKSSIRAGRWVCCFLHTRISLIVRFA